MPRRQSISAIIGPPDALFGLNGSSFMIVRIDFVGHLFITSLSSQLRIDIITDYFQNINAEFTVGVRTKIVTRFGGTPVDMANAL